MKRNDIVSLFAGFIGLGMLIALLSATGSVGARGADVRSEAASSTHINAATPLTSAFRYQGQLNSGGSPVTGACDFQFGLWDSVSGPAQIGITQTLSAPVVAGLFTVLLNSGNQFGADAFSGSQRWLAIAVNCPSVGGGYVLLQPRQQLTAAPYALYSAAPWETTNSNTIYYNSGNVGIGTTAPAHRLSISGGPTWTSNLWSGALALSNGSAIGWQVNSGGQRFGIGQTTGGLVFFRTASDPGTTNSPAIYDMVITNAGNVGIGIADTDAKLEVNGTLIADGITDNGTFQFQIDGSPGSALVCYTGNTLQVLTTCSSSLRYKTDVHPYAGGMDVVNRLKPVTFTWKDSGALDIGFIAEDIAAVEPLLATYNDSGEIEGVKYERMGVLFANALKEQQAQIKQQQAQLSQQQDEIESLKAIICLDHPEASLCQ
jgi:hypothetical protein